MNKGPDPQAASTQKAAPSNPAPNRPSRGLEVMTTLALVAALGLVLVTAMPAILRAAGVGPYAETRRFSLPEDGLGPSPLHPPKATGTVEEDDEEAPEEDEIAPTRPRSRAEEAEPEDPRSTRIRPAFVRSTTKLLVEASEDAAASGEVREGDTVFVIQERGEWVLVFRTNTDGIIKGWIQRSRLAIR